MRVPSHCFPVPALLTIAEMDARSLIKQGLPLLRNVWGLITSPFMLIGLFVYLIAMGIWMYVLGEYEYSYVYPMVALVYVFGFAYSKFLFHEKINIYRWLGELPEDVILNICAIIRDWGPRMTNCKRVEILSVPTWSDEKVEAYMTERVRVHREAEELDTMPAECTELERWIRPAHYSVKKQGNKKATKLFKLDKYDGDMDAARVDAEAFAFEKGDGFDVILCKSLPKRCMEYCEVAQVCPYWKERCAAEQDNADW